jgi:carboxylesterase type B
MQAIFQPLLHSQKWWYVIPMAPRTKPLFHSLIPESGQQIDTDTTSDQRASAQLLHSDEGAREEIGSLLADADVDNVDEADPDLATSEYGADEAIFNDTDDPSIDLCIELGSGDLIDIDEDTNIFLTIDIDPFLVIDSYADQNS